MNLFNILLPRDHQATGKHKWDILLLVRIFTKNKIINIIWSGTHWWWVLKETRTCHPQIHHFDIKILSWRQSSKQQTQKKLPPFWLKAGYKFSFHWQEMLIRPERAPEESANKPGSICFLPHIYPPWYDSWKCKTTSFSLSFLYKFITLSWGCYTKLNF